MSLIRELRRRNVFRVAAAYVVASWLIMQVASVIARPLNLPDWFETFVVVLVAIGFPIAVLLAWAYELTPDGLQPKKYKKKRLGTFFQRAGGADTFYKNLVCLSI